MSDLSPLCARKRTSPFALSLRVHAVDSLGGRKRPELRSDLRSFPVGNYIIFYVPLPDVIEVVRVMSGLQDIDADDIA
ncbi:type II toxin-antitoxin system RelE/ParE family toxin [Bradyrhizobium sp. KBS0727]|uniref:type II toxin-antitoxin system RelE/ParE family toxin n=1 Tax=unclassified Bradyrhizobium TaxID=2631580 RepID=UPI00110D2C4E|nr:MULTISPECIES: type II toxin-antitoxin system RelE/ParE family toxin [unclassified Bradyrhizobium]QDW36087.1 type II toxin-antitoxin system RelE/ParE family toxin [Bradyrhizobium sp. KBS0725]QDW42687.1 type II toxin-antitoxin system RelE/ParE family toxin [Bradyrhizobium sp. KBS0727]